MEMLDLLEKMMKFAGEKEGQKPGDQWRGTDKAPPGKKLVGDSILKDLSKGPTPKSKEQELSEEFQAFLEAEFKDTVDKRPRRASDRHPRGHEPKPRYKTIKTDEGVPYKATNPHPALQDPVIAKTVKQMRPGLEGLEMNNEAFLYFAYELGKDRARGMWEEYGPAIKYFYRSGIGVNEGKRKQFSMTNQQMDTLVAKLSVIEQLGLAEVALRMANTSDYGMSDQTFDNFLFRAQEALQKAERRYWQTSGDEPDVSLEEGWESGPEEYEEPYDDADDWYDRKRQEKLDAETEKEWAKRPQEKVYYLIGRGPNMEPNYEFPGEFKSLEDAIAARKKIMADPKTPHPEHIGIHSYTHYLDQTNEAIDSDIVQGIGQDAFNRSGYNPIRDERDYLNRLSGLSNLARKPGLTKEMQDEIFQRINDLNAAARKKGYKVESRAHKTLATFFKNRELTDKFAKGELKIPTPQERAELQKKLDAPKKQVKEYGADNISPYGQPATTPSVDPKQLAQGMQQFKAATGSTAPTTNLAKAIDTLSQGKLPTQQMVKDIQPAMKDLATITQNPNLASGAAKTAFQQANQARIRQQQLAKK